MFMFLKLSTAKKIEFSKRIFQIVGKRTEKKQKKIIMTSVSTMNRVASCNANHFSVNKNLLKSVVNIHTYIKSFKKRLIKEVSI